jgi:hypothetical protein
LPQAESGLCDSILHVGTAEAASNVVASPPAASSDMTRNVSVAIIKNSCKDDFVADLEKRLKWLNTVPTGSKLITNRA